MQRAEIPWTSQLALVPLQWSVAAYRRSALLADCRPYPAGIQ
ncbi:hypothetical protein [Nostoc sp.]